ncbi:MAG TPA: hypothetical protein VIX87_03460 [Steroidobacteraceae bacterium]
MRIPSLAAVAAMAVLLAPCAGFGATSTADDRIAVSADGATLSGTNGGGGASLGWLHNFDPESLASIAVEHQVLSDAHWTFGSLSGSLTRDLAGARYSAYAEAHEGAGDDGPRAFHYAIEAAGIIGTYFQRLSLQLEDRQVDVETTHGNLPKLGLSYLWPHRVMLSTSYSYSVNGNLGTRLATARIDGYTSACNLLAGVAFGPAAPAILNLQSGLVAPGRQLKEGYVGISKPLRHSRSELTLVADYLELAGVKRATLTLSYVFHVGGAGSAR